MKRIILLMVLSFLLAACTPGKNPPESFETWRLPHPGEDRDERVPVVWLGTAEEQAILGTVSSFSIEDKNLAEGGVTGMPASPAELGELLARVELAADQSAVVIIADEAGAIHSIEASTQLWTLDAMENFALFAGEPVAGYGRQEGNLYTYTLEPLGTAADALLIVAIEFDNRRASGDIVLLWRLNPGAPSPPDRSVMPTDEGSALDITGFIDALRLSGAEAVTAGTFTAAFFTGTPQLVRVNGVDIQVYEYAASMTAEQEAREAAPDGEIIIPAEWIATPHFFWSGHLIVQYIGDDPDMIALLESLLGPQFAKGG